MVSLRLIAAPCGLANCRTLPFRCTWRTSFPLLIRVIDARRKQVPKERARDRARSTGNRYIFSCGQLFPIVGHRSNTFRPPQPRIDYARCASIICASSPEQRIINASDFAYRSSVHNIFRAAQPRGFPMRLSPAITFFSQP